jgi:acyl-CoA dehydrogenase
MQFDLTDEQNQMVETARKIGARFGAPYWRDHDSRKAFPEAFWAAVCEAGLCGVALPEEYGGAGLGMLEMALIIEQLAAGGGGATLAMLFVTNPIFGGLSISRFGSQGMKEAVLPKIASGKTKCCMALTEADVGTNTFEIKTFAERSGNGWRLNGQKVWITGVETAQKMLVVARTTKLEMAAKRTQGITMFMIDVPRKGLTYAPIEKLGTNTLSSCTVFFDDVAVDGSELVGTLDGGWYELVEILNTERIAVTAGLVGAANLATRLAVEYAKERRVFGGRPIAAYQGIQFPLAQRWAEIECARLMNFKAAVLFDRGLPYVTEANVAKLLSSQAASAAIEQSMQTMGGMGFAKDMHVERLWRDARLGRFAPISEEMILNFIANLNLGMPRSY